MPPSPADLAWLDAAARLALRGRPLARPNPSVGCVIVRDGWLVGRGWTQAAGRPHAEAVALAQAGTEARGATLYATLEPCAHSSERGPACADLAAAAGLARVVVGTADPDPRTNGAGIARLRGAGVTTELLEHAPSAASLAGYLARTTLGRPHVTLKLALSDDCRLAPREGQWLTGPQARAHVHAWRARMDAILVGRGTLEADAPRLDVRLPGIAGHDPERWLLTTGTPPAGWRALPSPQAIAAVGDAQWLMVEGGGRAARGFLAAGLVDRMVLYRAPVTVGGGGPALPELAADAIGPEWQLADSRQLGNDRLDVYERA